jgi:hypothetical protein
MSKAWIAAAALAVVVFVVGWFFWSTRVGNHVGPIVLPPTQAPTESAVGLAEPGVGFHVEDFVGRA